MSKKMYNIIMHICSKLTFVTYDVFRTSNCAWVIAELSGTFLGSGLATNAIFPFKNLATAALPQAVGGLT